ncbi:MAG: dipeptidase [Clostridia bacterium]
MDYFDLHCDTISECERSGQGLDKNSFALSLARGQCFDRWAQVFALFIPDRLRGEAAFDHARRLYSCFRAELERNSGRASFCRNAREVDQAYQDHKCACLLSIEGGSALGGEVENVLYFYRLGVRIMTLTWDGRNELGSGSKVSGGLTKYGEAVLEAMGRCGMAVDVSHLNPETFWQVCRRTHAPLIATHSDCFDCWPHVRNIKKEQIRTIVRRGGLIGLNLYPEFLGPGDPVERIAANIRYLCALGAEDHIAFGCDFDGAPMPRGFGHVDDMPGLYRALAERGLPEKLLGKCFYRNARNRIVHIIG